MQIIIPIKTSDVEFWLNKGRLYVSIFANGFDENVCVEREIKKEELKTYLESLQKIYDELS